MGTRDNLQENIRQIEQEDNAAKATVAPAPVPAQRNFQQFQQPMMMRTTSYNTNMGCSISYPVQQPMLQHSLSFNSQMSFQPLPTFQKQAIVPKQSETSSKFESFFNNNFNRSG